MIALRLSRWLLVAAGVGLGAVAALRKAGAGATGGRAQRSVVAGPAGALFVDDGGSGGLPVLFVHAFAGSASHWHAQLAHLRLRRRAVAIDLRGHGHSAPPAQGDYAVSSQADDIAAVADALGLERFVLVGHSMGGAAAVDYAGRHPGRVAGLVLVGAPGRSSPELSKQIVDALHADYAKVMSRYWVRLLQGARAGVRRRLETEVRALRRAPALAMIEATFAYDPLPALGRYGGPKLFVDNGQGDGADALHRQRPDVERQVIDGTSHWPQLDDPRRFNRVLDGFLARLA